MLKLAMATQSGQPLRERPLDEPAVQVPTVVPVTPPVWHHLDKSPGFSVWQQPAPHVPQYPYRATGTQPEIASPSSRLATWQAPVTDGLPFQSDSTLLPGPVPPVQAVPDAATTLPKHDFRLETFGRLTNAQKTELSSWLSSETPYPSLSAEIRRLPVASDQSAFMASSTRPPEEHRPLITDQCDFSHQTFGTTG